MKKDCFFLISKDSSLNIDLKYMPISLTDLNKELRWVIWKFWWKWASEALNEASGIVDCLPWMLWHLEDTIGVGLWDLSLGS